MIFAYHSQKRLFKDKNSVAEVSNWVQVFGRTFGMSPSWIMKAEEATKLIFMENFTDETLSLTLELSACPAEAENIVSLIERVPVKYGISQNHESINQEEFVEYFGTSRKMCPQFLCNIYCCKRGDPTIQGGYPYHTRFRSLTPYELMRRFLLCIITLSSVYFAIVGAIAKPTQTGYATTIIALFTLYRVVVFDLIVINVEHTSLPNAHLW